MTHVLGFQIWIINYRVEVTCAFSSRRSDFQRFDVNAHPEVAISSARRHICRDKQWLVLATTAPTARTQSRTLDSHEVRDAI